MKQPSTKQAAFLQALLENYLDDAEHHVEIYSSLDENIADAKLLGELSAITGIPVEERD